MNHEMLAVVSGIGTVLLGFVLFYFPWQTLVVDQTRQRLFEIRDRWFDYTMRLTDSADRVAAAGVRSEINDLIRLAHHVTLPTLFAAGIARAIAGNKAAFEDPTRSLIRGFHSSGVAEEAKKVLSESFKQVVIGMVRRSLLLLLLIPILALLAVVISTTYAGMRPLFDGLNGLIESLGRREDGKLARQ